MAVSMVKEKNILTNLQIVDVENNATYEGGISVENGIILDMGPHITSGDDMGGLTLIPGIVDMRMHLKDPGEYHKESLQETLSYALHSGITHIVAQPDTDPVMDTAGRITTLQDRAQNAQRKYSGADLTILGAITKSLNGQEIAEIGLMQKNGTTGFSNGNNSIKNTMVLRHAFEYASNFDCTFHMHASDADLSRDGLVHESNSTKLGLKGISAMAESLEIQRLISFSTKFNVKLHISHLSTKEGVEIIRQAKIDGVKITADVCHHHIAMCEDAIGEYKTFTKITPPLCGVEDRIALIEGLKDGTIDAVVSDHKADDSDSKRLPYAQAGFGALGLQTLLPITLSLYKNKHMSLIDSIKLITKNPSEINGLSNSSLSKGYPANFAVIDLNASNEITKETTLGKCKNTPYESMTLKGKVIHMYKNGKKVL